MKQFYILQTNNDGKYLYFSLLYKYYKSNDEMIERRWKRRWQAYLIVPVTQKWF